MTYAEHLRSIQFAGKRTVPKVKVTDDGKRVTEVLRSDDGTRSGLAIEHGDGSKSAVVTQPRIEINPALTEIARDVEKEVRRDFRRSHR